MNRTSRGVIAAAVGFAAAFLVGRASEIGSQRPETRPPVDLGALDLVTFCRGHGGEGFAATLVAPNANGWRCAGLRNGVWGVDEIEFDVTCSQQFGPSARAHTDDPLSPDSWRCVEASGG